MKQPLKPNKLAKTIDYQKCAARAIPRHLATRCLELNALSQEIKTLLDDCLPTEILHSLWVAKYEAGNLTLSVQSQTAANHLIYQTSNLINILREQSITFNQLNHINVIVTYFTSATYPNKLNQQSTKSSIQQSSQHTLSKSHDLHGLSQSTKRTIAHTATHVIKDERLRRSLQKLAKS